MLNLREPYAPFSTRKFWAFAIRGTLKANTHFSTTQKSLLTLRACPDIPHNTCPHNTQRSQRPNIPGSHPPYPSGRLQYQSSFYKPKTYKDMEEKTLFKLARAITDTGTDTVSSKGGTITYHITSLKRKLVNGKVVSTSTPSCTLGSASVNWATWKGVTVGNGYLDVKINYLSNMGSSRSTTLIFDQVESDNKIHLTVTQEAKPTFTLSGLPITGTDRDRGYYLFGKGASPRNTSSSDRLYLQRISAAGTDTIGIPFYANDSEPGTLIECTTGNLVSVYTQLGNAWTLEGSFVVPSAGGTATVR